MTSKADIVIIGGGIQGTSLAFFLAKEKAGKILLLEKKYIASGPTGQSGAMIRPLFMEETYIALVVASTRMFENWKDEVGGNPGFVQKGFLRITNSLDKEILGGDLELVRKIGEPYEILKIDDLKKLIPKGIFKGNEIGLLFPNGGYADPVRTATEFARAATELGVEILENTGINAIETQNGTIHAVVTKTGRINTRLVINCSGAWSHQIAKMVGIELPITIHRTPTCLFRCPDSMKPEGPILSDNIHRVYLRGMGTELLRAAHFGWAPDPADPDNFDETVNMHQVNQLQDGIHKRYTEMRKSPFSGGFSALYDMTPDGHPIISEMPDIRGFWCNCGWSGNGFASAPAIGKCLAKLLLGKKSDIDLAMFQWPRKPNLKSRADMKWIYR